MQLFPINHNVINTFRLESHWKMTRFILLLARSEYHRGTPCFSRMGTSCSSEGTRTFVCQERATQADTSEPFRPGMPPSSVTRSQEACASPRHFSESQPTRPAETIKRRSPRASAPSRSKLSQEIPAYESGRRW